MKNKNPYDILVDDQGPEAIKVTAWTIEEALLGGFKYAWDKYPQGTFDAAPPVEVDIFDEGRLVGRGVQTQIYQNGRVN